MLTKKQLSIFESLTKNIFNEYTIKEIKESSKEKSNNAISLALKKFKEENLVNEKKIGKSFLYSININNDAIFYYLGLINSEKISKDTLRTIRILKEEIEKYTFFYSIVIFGSYAINKQTEKSDLDIAIFIENKNKGNILQAALNSAELKSLIKLDAHIITELDFFKMLKVDEENLGKQIARKHLSIYNHKIFYSLLNKGIQNGFKL